MRSYNFSEIQTHDGKLAFQDQLQGMLKYGFSWPQEIALQEKFISIIQQDIDQRYSLLRNYPIQEVEVAVPMLFIGPPGVRVIFLCKHRGIYRAQESHWFELSGKNFRPAKDNLIKQTQLYVRSVQKLMREIQHPDVKVDGLIICMDPGMHVDSQRPDVRVVQFDALRNLGPQWNQEEPVLSPENVYQLVAALRQLAEPLENENQRASAQQGNGRPREDKLAQTLAPLGKNINFNTQQWIVLALLLFGTVIVLLILMFIVLLSL